MITVIYTIPNISCHHCTHTVEMEISEIKGVESVKADIESKRATITFQSPATEEKIKSLLAEINYPVES